MKCTYLSSLMLAVLLSPISFSAESLAVNSREEQKQHIQSCFRYDPAKHEAAVAAAAELSAAQPAVEGVVMMEKFTVQESFSRQSLEAVIQNDRASREARHVKYGTGLRTAKVGKVRFFAATALYVPVIAGFTLEW